VGHAIGCDLGLGYDLQGNAIPPLGHTLWSCPKQALPRTLGAGSGVGPMARPKPPARRRYEAAHPCVTVRVPAEVLQDLRAGAAAAGLSVSAWVAALVRQGEAARRRASEAERREAVRTGFHAGLLAATLAHAEGRRYHPRILLKRLEEQPPELVALAEQLVLRDLRPAWERLRRGAGRR